MLDLLPFSSRAGPAPGRCAIDASGAVGATRRTAALDTLRLGTGYGRADRGGLQRCPNTTPTVRSSSGPSVALLRGPALHPRLGLRSRADNGRRLTFGADCGPNDAIVELARDTDTLMLEATEGPARTSVRASVAT